MFGGATFHSTPVPTFNASARHITCTGSSLLRIPLVRMKFHSKSFFSRTTTPENINFGQLCYFFFKSFNSQYAFILYRNVKIFQLGTYKIRGEKPKFPLRVEVIFKNYRKLQIIQEYYPIYKSSVTPGMTLFIIYWNWETNDKERKGKKDNKTV